MSRFAGQAVDITQFMPKDGPQYDMIADQVMGMNTLRKNTGLAAQAQFNTAGVNSAATAQIGNQKGRMLISQGELNAAKILAGAEANAAQQRAQGDANLWSGIASGIGGFATGGLGAAKNAGMFSGGGGGGISFADGMNSGLPTFGDYSGIPAGGWGVQW